jgi:hypothetical protein
MFVSKAGAYQIKASLLNPFVKYGRKKFYKIGHMGNIHNSLFSELLTNGTVKLECL